MTNLSRPTTVLTACIALSGCSALIYEIIWFRRLANVVGATVQAASITTAVFLVGLALGAIWFGTRADQVRRPLRLYARLEFFIAGCGLLVPWLIDRSGLLLAGSPDRFALTLLIGGAILLPPTIAMGGTLPVLCRAMAGKRLGNSFALLYALNTVGGAVGCLMAAFVLIPFYGEHVTIGLAVVGNLFAAGGVFLLAQSKAGEGLAVAPLPLPCGQPVSVRAPLWPLPALAATGFVTLAAQILWLRFFPLVLGNTTQAFALILTLFLLGLAIGSIYARRRLRTSAPHSRPLLPALLLAAGLLPTLLAADKLAYASYALQLAAVDAPWLLAAGQAAIVALLVLPPTIASGALLPALVDLAQPTRPGQGHQVGRALFANTLGAVAGSLAVPLLLIACLGIQSSFRVLTGLALLVVLLMVSVLPARRSGVYGAVLILLLAVIFPPKWDQRLLSSGAYIYAEEMEEAGGMEAVFAARKILDYREGIEATVAVFEREQGYRSFSVNGKIDGGIGDMPTQVLLGQLPLLLHPAPKKGLVIGLGTGITLAESMKFPGFAADCSEIEPGVVHAAGYFADEHGGVLDNPLVRLQVGDARQQLLATGDSYDIIISEPSNPWQAGNSRLFTRDFYRLAATRLNPGGIFSQWLPIYDLPPEFLRSALATFIDTFPHAVGFLVGRSDLILVAHDAGELRVSYPQLVDRWRLPGVSERQHEIGNSSPAELLARHLLGGEELLALLTHGAPVNSDAHNRLEFLTKRQQNYGSDNLAMMGAALDQLPVQRWLEVLDLASDKSRSVRRQLAQSFDGQGRRREAQALLSADGGHLVTPVGDGIP